MSQFKAKQIEKGLASYVRVTGFVAQAGTSSFNVTAPLANALASAGEGGNPVMLQPYENKSGIIIQAPHNRVEIYTAQGYRLVDAAGEEVYGRMTYNFVGQTFHLNLFTLRLGVETVYQFTGSTAIMFEFPYVFTFGTLPATAGIGHYTRGVNNDPNAMDVVGRNVVNTPTINWNYNTATRKLEANVANVNELVEDAVGALFDNSDSVTFNYDDAANIMTFHVVDPYVNALADARINMQKGVAGGITPLDADVLIPNQYLPPLAISETFVATSEADMLALIAQRGDVVVRTDLTKTYILTTDDPTDIDNWQEMLNPLAPVQSVNGMVGVVNLTTTHIAEGDNQYFTNARARGSISMSNALTYNAATGLGQFGGDLIKDTTINANSLYKVVWNNLTGFEVNGPLYQPKISLNDTVFTTTLGSTKLQAERDGSAVWLHLIAKGPSTYTNLAINGTGDGSGTGFYLIQSNPYTVGLDKVTLIQDQFGKFGVMTATPQYTVDINGDLRVSTIAHMSSPTKILVSDAGVVKYANTSDILANGGNYIWNQNAASQVADFRIHGMGTILHNTANDSTFTVTQNAVGLGNEPSVKWFHLNGYGWRWRMDNNSADFYLDRYAGSWTNGVMHIRNVANSGHVGIGRAPDHRLDVNGVVRTNERFVVGEDLTVDYPEPQGVIKTVQDINNNSFIQMLNKNTGDFSTVGLMFTTGQATHGQQASIVYRHKESKLQLTGNTFEMTAAWSGVIKFSNGYLGYMTGDNELARMDLNGDIFFRPLRGTGNRVVMTDGSGKIFPGSDIATLVATRNGINNSSGYIELGGALMRDTYIANSYNGGTAYNFSIYSRTVNEWQHVLFQTTTDGFKFSPTSASYTGAGPMVTVESIGGANGSGIYSNIESNQWRTDKYAVYGKYNAIVETGNDGVTKYYYAGKFDMTSSGAGHYVTTYGIYVRNVSSATGSGWANYGVFSDGGLNYFRDTIEVGASSQLAINPSAGGGQYHWATANSDALIVGKSNTPITIVNHNGSAIRLGNTQVDIYGGYNSAPSMRVLGTGKVLVGDVWAPGGAEYIMETRGGIRLIEGTPSYMELRPGYGIKITGAQMGPVLELDANPNQYYGSMIWLKTPNQRAGYMIEGAMSGGDANTSLGGIYYSMDRTNGSASTNTYGAYFSLLGQETNLYGLYANVGDTAGFAGVAGARYALYTEGGRIRLGEPKAPAGQVYQLMINDAGVVTSQAALSTGSFIQNRTTSSQAASFWISGTGSIGAEPNGWQFGALQVEADRPDGLHPFMVKNGNNMRFVVYNSGRFFSNGIEFGTSENSLAGGNHIIGYTHGGVDGNITFQQKALRLQQYGVNYLNKPVLVGNIVDSGAHKFQVDGSVLIDSSYTNLDMKHSGVQEFRISVAPAYTRIWNNATLHMGIGTTYDNGVVHWMMSASHTSFVSPRVVVGSGPYVTNEQFQVVGGVYISTLNDNTGVAKMVTTTNGVLSYAAIPTGSGGSVTLNQYQVAFGSSSNEVAGSPNVTYNPDSNYGLFKLAYSGPNTAQSSPIMVIENPTGGNQSAIDFTYNNVTKGRWRVDSNGGFVLSGGDTIYMAYTDFATNTNLTIGAYNATTSSYGVFYNGAQRRLGVDVNPEYKFHVRAETGGNTGIATLIEDNNGSIGTMLAVKYGSQTRAFNVVSSGYGFANMNSGTFQKMDLFIDNNGNMAVGATGYTVDNPDGWDRVFQLHGTGHSRFVVTQGAAPTSPNIRGIFNAHQSGYYGAQGLGAGFYVGTETITPMYFVTGGVSRAFITTTGNIILGGATSTNTGDMLQVNGSIWTNGKIDMDTAVGNAGETNRIDMYGGIYGFGISASLLSYISNGAHTFYTGNAVAMFTIQEDGDVWSKKLDDQTGVAKMVTTTNGVLGYQSIPSGVAPQFENGITLNATSQKYGLGGTLVRDTHIDTTDYDFTLGAFGGGGGNYYHYLDISRNSLYFETNGAGSVSQGFMNLYNGTTRTSAGWQLYIQKDNVMTSEDAMWESGTGYVWYREIAYMAASVANQPMYRFEMNKDGMYFKAAQNGAGYKNWRIGPDGNLFADNMNDGSGTPRMVVVTNGTFGYQNIVAGTSYSYQNGLSEPVAGTVKWGGNLNGNTMINGLESFNVNFQDLYNFNVVGVGNASLNMLGVINFTAPTTEVIGTLEVSGRSELWGSGDTGFDGYTNNLDLKGNYPSIWLFAGHANSPSSWHIGINGDNQLAFRYRPSGGSFANSILLHNNGNIYAKSLDDTTSTARMVVSVNGVLSLQNIPTGGSGADGNNYPTGVSFNTSTGNLVINRNGLTDISTSLDGRYVTSIAHSHGIADVNGNQQFTFAINENVRIEGTGNTSVSFDAATKRIIINSTAGTGADGNNYPTAFSWTAGTGVLGLSRNGLADITINLDGRYLTSVAHSHGVANAAGTQQFTFGVGDNIRFEGTGNASVTYDAATKRVIINATSGGTAFTINNNANDRIMTATGNANEANAESYLTWDGGLLKVGNPSFDTTTYGGTLTWAGWFDNRLAVKSEIYIQGDSLASFTMNGTNGGGEQINWDRSGIAKWQWYHHPTNDSIYYYWNTGSGGTKTWSPNFEFTTTGVFRAGNDIVGYYNFSDRRLKTDIVYIDDQDMYEALMDMKPVKYSWKDDLQRRELGFIAQEIEELVPELVSEEQRLGDSTKYKRIAYDKIGAVVVGALKHQDKRMKVMEEKLDTIMKQLNLLN